MDIQNNNVTIQINAKDLSGRKLRVADCDIFIVHVFTQDPAFYLSYTGRDMLMTETVDELTIPKKDMEHLQSGVVQYTYHYLPAVHIDNRYEAPEFDPEYDADGVPESVPAVPLTPAMPMCPSHFHHHHKPGDYFEEQLINSRLVVTDIYWRNLKPNHHHDPHHPHEMGRNEIDRLHRMLDVEIFNRQKETNSLNKAVEEEVNRATKEDERLLSLIDDLKNVQESFASDSDTKNEEVENKLEETSNKVADEEARAVKAEADLLIKIKEEETARKGADEILEAKIVMEKERAQANESNLTDRISSVSEKFESFKSIQSEALSTEIARAKQVETEINTKINGVVADLNAEISRAAQKDIEHSNLVETEANRAKAVEDKLSVNLQTEIDRAKDAEKHILDEVHDVQTTVASLATATNVYTKAEVDKKISDVRNDVSTLENQVANHEVTSTELSTKVSQLVADVDKAKADILAEVAKCDAQNGKLATDIQTLSDSVYSKAEVDNQILTVDASIAGINNWINNHKDNTEGLNEKVTKLIADTEQLHIDVLNEATLRANEDSSIASKIAISDGKIDAEIERAKASEKLIADELADFKANATAKHSDIETAIAGVNADLVVEVARAKAAEKVNADAIAIITADSSTAGSIKKALADGKDYTDAEIAKLSLAKNVELVDTLKDYATNEAVDKKISDVIGTAPEALDTLGKISSALSQDSDAITAINGILAGKADSSLVYTKSEVDTLVNGISNSISTLETKSDNADATINSRIDDIVTKVAGIETNIAVDSSTLSGKIDDEITRAKAAEKSNSDKIDSEISKLSDKYNELNAKVIQDIADSTAKDTEIDANISAIQTQLTNVETKVDAEVIRATAKDNELVARDTEIEAKVDTNSATIASEITRAKQVETELNDKINSIDIAGCNSAISSLAASVTQLDADSKAKDSELETLIVNEKTRAEGVEQTLSDKIDILNGDENTVGSLAHAVHDANHYTDDCLTNYVSLDVLTQTVDNAVASSQQFTTLSNSLNAEVLRAKQAEKEITDSIENVNVILEDALKDLNSLFGDDEEGEGGGKLSGIVTRDELTTLMDDYYTKDEITQVLTDFVTKDEADEKYLTKEVADATYLQGVQMTADEYAALQEAGEVQENVLYIII